jgi:hypothetical protein
LTEIARSCNVSHSTSRGSRTMATPGLSRRGRVERRASPSPWWHSRRATGDAQDHRRVRWGAARCSGSGPSSMTRASYLSQIVDCRSFA